MTQPLTASSPGISKTSIFVAAGRAVGAREPDPSARNPDHLAELLLGDPSTLEVDHPAVRALQQGYEQAMKDIEVVSHVRMMTIRTRFIDEALERAVAGGAAQVVILGAGFDSHAYRCRALLAKVKVYEVDRPQMQAFKRQRVNDVIGQPPDNLTYVPVDFEHEDLGDVLRRHGYDPSARTFFILEGVSMYLPEDAVRATFCFVASHPAGSGIVFDFVYRSMIDRIANIDMAAVPEAARAFVQRFLNMTRHEPWIFGIPDGREREFLTELGLDAREILTIGGEDSMKRYATRSDGTQVGAEAVAEAMARMAEQARAASSQSGADAMSPDRMREQQRAMVYQMVDAVTNGSPPA